MSLAIISAIMFSISAFLLLMAHFLNRRALKVLDNVRKEYRSAERMYRVVKLQADWGEALIKASIEQRPKPSPPIELVFLLEEFRREGKL